MKKKLLRVAVVLGDDVLPWMREHEVPLLDSDRTVRSLEGRLVSANAYLGAEALLPALRSGADVVITGRVADPALFLAPDLAKAEELILDGTLVHSVEERIGRLFA